MKSITVFLIWLCAVTAYSQEPERLSVQDLLEKATDTEDITYMSQTFFRCNAIFSVLIEIVQRGLGEEGKERLEAFENAISINLGLAIQVSNRIREERGLEPFTDEEEIEYVMNMARSHMDYYFEKMNSNYMATGEYFSDDPQLSEEIQSCSEMTAVFNQSNPN